MHQYWKVLVASAQFTQVYHFAAETPAISKGFDRPIFQGNSRWPELSCIQLSSRTPLQQLVWYLQQRVRPFKDLVFGWLLTIHFPLNNAVKHQKLNDKLSRFFVYAVYPLLVILMLLLLGTTYISQQNLREVAKDELRFNLEKRASALGYFYSERMSDIDDLSRDHTLTSYLANEALGMSMEYGLRTSLLNLRSVFQDLVTNKKIESIPVYLRLMYIDDKNRKLIDVGSESGQIDSWIDSDPQNDINIRFKLIQNQDDTHVLIQSPGHFMGQKKGLIIAEINQKQVFENLVHQQLDDMNTSFRLVVGENGDSKAIHKRLGDDLTQSTLQPGKKHERENDFIIKIMIPGTPFFLIATHHGPITGDYLISNAYLLSLVLLSFLVFLTIAIGIRTRATGLALYGQFEESQRQSKVLEEFVAARTNDLTIAKNEAEQVQQMLQIVLDTIPVRVFWKDKDLFYLGCNKLFAKDAGLKSPEDLIGKSDFDMGWADQAELYQKDDRKVIKSQQPKLDYEEPQTTPDGKTIWLLTSKIPLHDKHGNSLGMLGTYTEITERKRAEEQMEIARLAAERANRAKSEFLANMSHELRTPMHAILSFSDIGMSKVSGENKDKLLQYFSRINESGQRLLSLLDELLDLSKLEAGRMQFNFERQNLQTVIDIEVTEFQELLNKKSLKLEIIRPEFDTVCHFDQQKMLQVIRNLLSNAIKFTSEGKEIRIDFQLSELSSGKRKTDKLTVPALSFSIADEGIGIPDDELIAVFDKFVQSSKTRTGAGGTGLGLAICKEIVDNHGGRIEAANRPEGGAIFTVTLPISQTAYQLSPEPDYHYPDTQVAQS